LGVLIVVAQRLLSAEEALGLFKESAPRERQAG
jgi:hypothetical protein